MNDYEIHFHKRSMKRNEPKVTMFFACLAFHTDYLLLSLKSFINYLIQVEAVDDKSLLYQYVLFEVFLEK